MRMRKIIIAILLILVMCPTTVYADENETPTTTSSFNCGNDGQPKNNADDCYKDSGLVSSFANVEYVDCAVPYDITLSQLGGTYASDLLHCHEWFTLKSPDAMGGVYDFKSFNSNGYGKYNIGDKGNRENDYSTSILNGCMNKLKEQYPNISVQREDVSGANYVEVNGIRYYMAAVGQYFYNLAAENNKENSEWLKVTHGSIFDVILTDGQVFHYIMADCMGVAHSVKSNESVSFYKCVKQAGDSDHSRCQSTATVCSTNFTALIKPHYKGIVHASAGQLLEMWYGAKDQGYSEASVSNQPVYKYIAEHEDVHIAYIRRYNLTVADLDKIQLNTGVPKGASWHMVYGANSAEAKALNAGGNAKALRVGYQEQELSSWVRLAESNIAEQLDDANVDNLKGDDLVSIYNWKTIVTDSNAPVYLKVVRIVIQLVGVLMLIWSILLYVGYWLDTVNNLIDINIVGILTLGKLASGREEDSNYNQPPENGKNNKVRIVSHKNIMLICGVTILFAVLILTGAFYNLLASLIYTILGFFQ